MSDERLARIRGIYPIADDDPRWRNGPRAVVESALLGGATVVQLRLKHTIDREALELARWACERAHEAGAILIVNDRFDLADLAGADGVHIGEEDLAPERIPEDVRGRLLIGLSTHTLEQVRESRTRPVDYIGFGPVFGTSSKDPGYSPRGLDMLREAAESADRPVVAIGGITAENLPDVARNGASAAAVISALTDAVHPRAETEALQAGFTER